MVFNVKNKSINSSLGRNMAGNIIIYAFLIALFVFAAFPLVYTLLASFKSNSELMSNPDKVIPIQFTTDNYISAWNSENFPVPRLTLNSIYFSLISVAAAVLNASVCGYVFARGHFTGMKIVFGVFTSLMFVSLGGATAVPLIGIAKKLGLSGSLSGLLITRIFGVNVVNLFLVRSFVQSLPHELDEAATIDGCGFIGILFKIYIPLLTPILSTVGVLAFQSSWNEAVMPIAFTMNNPMQRTLAAGLYSLKNSGETAAQWNLMMAGSVISMIPVLFVYTFGSKYMISGLAAGAVKG